MLENFTFLKKKGKKEPSDKSKNAAKERLHLVLMQDRANVSADFLEMMKHEIVDVIKKYIDVDETDMDVKLENRVNNDGTSGAPALYANIPIVGINEEKKKESVELSKVKQAEEINENINDDKDEDNIVVDEKEKNKEVDDKKEDEKKKTKKVVSTRKANTSKEKTTKSTKAKTTTSTRKKKNEKDAKDAEK